MKKMFLTICLIFLLPALVQAENFQNTDFGFKIELPDTWHNVTAEYEDTIFPILQYKDSTGSLGVIDIYAENATKAFSSKIPSSFEKITTDETNDMIDLLISDLNENYPQVTILSNEKTTINNLTAVVIVHSYVYLAENDTPVKVNGFWVVFVENDILYSLKLQTDDTTGLHMSMFFQMCESFELLQKTNLTI